MKKASSAKFNVVINIHRLKPTLKIDVWQQGKGQGMRDAGISGSGCEYDGKDGGERARTHLGNCGMASGYCHRAKEFHFSKALFTSVVFFFSLKNK